MFKKILSIFLMFTIITTQTAMAAESAEYTYKIYSVVNNSKQLISEVNNASSINYSSLFNNMSNLLFDNNYENVVLEIINKTTNAMIEEKKKTEFLPKNANTLVDQSDSIFGKTFELDYNDDDGMYVGFIENHLSTLSRGYYIKKYSEFDKSDGVEKEYVEMGKANFVNDMAQSLFDYKLLKKTDKVQPLLLSYLNYNATYANFVAPSSYTENSYGWNGLINLNSGENTVRDIKNKLLSLKSSQNKIQNRDFATLTGEDNRLFMENGKVLNYRTNTSNEELFAHLSMANTFMANNNIKRGFMFKPVNSLNNYKFDSFKKCSGKIRKKCTYWQELDYTGGLDVYTMSFLDESYMDDWKEITYKNSDIVGGSVVVPTMVPVNSYANLPSVNSENYGFLYSTNYAGSVGGYGIYNYPVNTITGVNDSNRHVKSDTIQTKGWTMLALIIMAVAVVALAPFAIAAVGALSLQFGAIGVMIFTVGEIALFAGTVGALAATIYILKHLHKDADSGTILKMNESQIRATVELSNSIIPQSSDEYGSLELAESSVLNGLITNTSLANIKKNFMSNTFHDIANTHAKNNLSAVPASYFGSSIGIIDSMDQNPKFWKSKHINGIINGYKNSFYNDGKNASTGSKYGAFYNMKTIYRNLVKEYTGY